MNAFRQWQRAIVGGVLVVLALAAWIVLAPLQLGGQSAYIIINGNSMEPRFHWGDLVVVRKQAAYSVGDIAAYHNADLDRFVFHRIVASQSNHFIFRGDHNTWDDGYQPAPGEVVGKYWFALPRLGNAVRWLRQPLNLGILAGILGGLLVVILFQRQTGNESKMNKITLASSLAWLRRRILEPVVAWLGRIKTPRWLERAEMVPAGESHSAQPLKLRSWGANLEIIFFVLALIFCGSAILGYFAFTRPAVRQVDIHLPYQHLGTFSYSAPAPAGIYDSRSVQSGDPIFPGLTCTVDMRFNYVVAGVLRQDVSGSYQLFARIIDTGSGWQRSLPLTQPQAFAGGSFAARAPIDLCQVEKLVSAVRDATGLRSSTYTLRITPVVTLAGTVSGIELHDKFEPNLDFRFDDVLFALTHEDPEVDPLKPVLEGDLTNTVSQPNTIPILGLEFAVMPLRLLSVFGLLLSVIGLAAVGIAVASLVRSSQVGLVQLKYGSLLVDASDKNLDHSHETVEITSIDDLARLAEKHNTVILAQERNRIHYYSVRGDGRNYRYAVSEWIGSSSSVPLIQLEDDLRKGLERGEFQVYYQPILSLADGKIFGVEALLRWQHPLHGVIPAGQFLPAAEAAGLMNPLGDWLLGVACRQIRDWQGQGLALDLSINLSEQELLGDPAASFRRVVKSTGVDPHRLQVEVPSPALMEMPQQVIPKLQDLKDLGLQISVEESGGTSALSSTFQFPLTGIKIEREAVERIIDRDRVIGVHRMIEAAHGRGLQIGAVGVETQEQMEFLRSERCNFAQGYLVGRPATAEQLCLTLLGSLNRRSAEDTMPELDLEKEPA